MRLSLGFEQKQVQKQILAPRMIQSMEILQLPLQELEARIDQELNENPLLERQEGDPELPEETPPLEETSPAVETDKEFIVEDNNSNADDFDRLSDLSREVPDFFDEQPRMSSNRLAELSDRQHDAVANIQSRGLTLQDSLEMQLRELELPPAVWEVAIRIISTLDSNGYLLVALEDLLPPQADQSLFEISRASVADHSISGTCWRRRSLVEGMSLTSARAADAVIRGNADHCRRPSGRPEGQSSAADSKEDGVFIRENSRDLGRSADLNPKPGAGFEEAPVQTVTPDVYVDRDESGKYVVRLEERGMPHLRISNYYRKRLASGEATAEEREYIKRKINAAQWLMESIEQRRSTLTKVAQAIVDHQTSFLEEGPEAIEPLKMQQIADKVRVHVTTVSRAVDDKWIQTPRGVYALRNFFVGGTTDADGEEVAWDAIRRKLQEIVDHEDKTNPYSDDELVEQLQKNGFTVARRTVTKYRKKMDIPSSRQRRDWAQIESSL